MTYTERVAHGLEGLEAVSTGPCPGCDECRKNYGYSSMRAFSDAWECGEVVVEPHFSRAPCDICGSLLAGDREDWHAFDRETGATYHFHSACVDCVIYLANGDVPEGEE